MLIYLYIYPLHIYIKYIYAYIYMHVHRANKKRLCIKIAFSIIRTTGVLFYLFILCIMSIDLTCACEGYKIEIYKYLKGTIMYKKIIK